MKLFMVKKTRNTEHLQVQVLTFIDLPLRTNRTFAYNDPFKPKHV